MKVAMLIGEPLRSKLFSAGDLATIARMAEVDCLDDDQLVRTVTDPLAGADVIVTSWGSPRIDAALLAHAPEARLVIHAAGTVKWIVSDALYARNIRVSGGAGALGRGVAETALGMTIAALKNLWRLDRETTAGGWSGERGPVRELYEITVGVIGAGHAGRHYLRLLRGFEVEILLADPTLSVNEAADLGAELVSLDDLLRRSDVVSLHAPSLPATHKMLDAERLGLVKDDAILINTARGALIDEPALIAELRSGRLFACLDVTDPEPPAADSPLRTLPNCVLTGHVAGAVTNGLRRLGRHVVEELERYQRGQPLASDVPRHALDTVA